VRDDASSPISDPSAPPALRSWRGAVDRCARTIGLDRGAALALVRTLDARIPRIASSVLDDPALDAAALRRYAGDELASGAARDPCVSLAAHALAKPTFVRLFELARAWDPSGDADADAAAALQRALSAWWDSVDDGCAMIRVVGSLAPAERASVELVRAAADVVVAFYRALTGDDAAELATIAVSVERWTEGDGDELALLDAARASAMDYRAEMSARFRRAPQFSAERFRCSFLDTAAWCLIGIAEVASRPSARACADLIETVNSLWGRWQRRDTDYGLGPRSARFIGQGALVRARVRCPDLRAELDHARRARGRR
jgi:hypothetical protein